jgi:hypothetical protein
MKHYKTLRPADENKPPIHDDTYKPPLVNYSQPNSSFDKSPPYNDETPLNVLHKFPSFKGPHKQHMSSGITITDSYAMPLSEGQHKHISSSVDGLSDDDGYPQYDTEDHGTHVYDTYDSTKDHVSHDDSHGSDHDHIYNHEPKKYYYHHQSYDYEDHEIPAAHPPKKDHYHHPPLDEYGGVPHDHYHDQIYHRDPKEHYSDHHLHDSDDYELPAVHRPTKYNYRYPSSYAYMVETPPPEEPSPPKEMIENLTPPSNGMAGSSTPPANNMAEPATSPPPDMTQGPPPPPKDMVEVPPPPPNDMYGASPHLPLDMYMNHLYSVEGMYGVHSASIMTEEPMTSTTPMEKKPPSSYYYLGHKLWLVPVYGTGILLIQMLYLLLKAIARHKAVTPLKYITKLNSRKLETQRQQELDSRTEHVTEALETAEYRYM